MQRLKNTETKVGLFPWKNYGGQVLYLRPQTPADTDYQYDPIIFDEPPS